MGIETRRTATTESRLANAGTSESLLLQIRSDRRLGHEWDDWDGGPLPDAGVFRTSERLYFLLAGTLVGVCAVAVWLAVWLVAPRLDAVGLPVGRYVTGAVGVLLVLAMVWLGAVAVVVRTGRNWLPERLAERGLVPWMMPKLEAFARLVGVSRDRVGNAALRVHNRLMIARARSGMSPEEVLILLPRCLGKEAMRSAMSVSERYGVPLFVAARGRYARQMIAMRKPKGVVAVACERDLVSGVHDVAGRLPVLGTTLALSDGPCRNTDFELGELEHQVRSMLGLSDLTTDRN